VTGDGGDEWGGYIEEPDETVVDPDAQTVSKDADTLIGPDADTAVRTPADTPVRGGDDTVVQPRVARSPPPPPAGGGPAWTRVSWRIAIALVGSAAIAVGVIEVVSHVKSKRTSTTTTSTNTTLSKAAFIRRADAICAQLNPQVEDEYRIALADSNSGDLAGARAAIGRLETAANQLIFQITALGPPAQGEATINTLLNEYTELVNDAVLDTPESNAAADALQPQIAALARQYGFNVCGVT